MNVSKEYRRLRPSVPSRPRCAAQGRRRRRAARRVLRSDEINGGVSAADLGEGLVDDARVVLGQPVPKQRVRHAHAKRAGRFLGEAGGTEPGVVAVAVDLGFDPGQYLVQRFAVLMPGTFALGTQGNRPSKALPSRNPRRKRAFPGLTRALKGFWRVFERASTQKAAIFHNFFHSCGKLGGRLGERSRPVARPATVAQRQAPDNRGSSDPAVDRSVLGRLRLAFLHALEPQASEAMKRTFQPIATDAAAPTAFSCA